MSDITWYGHSAFRISAPGAQVVIDPFFAPSAGVSSSAAGDVDIVLVTHDHGDHVGDAVSLCRRTGAQLGAIASGATRNLVHRAADVALKERLPLVLVTRESPLSAIHLRNMLALREAGAVVMPVSPCFYLRPSGVDDLLEQFCGRIFDQVGLAHNLARWTGEA